jgi:hypothetical protein
MHHSTIVLFLFLYFFWKYWVLNSGLVFARQAIYSLSYASSPFLL